MSALHLWGGCECTVNRVGDTVMDQTVLTGTQERADDVDRIVSLGVRAVRLPLLWERIERAPGVRDFAWSDARIAAFRAHDVRVIAGLIHHGSGPMWTDLLDDGFAPGLASHARAVAERYPHLDAYTPVNEPFTTARFSCLYGHWYPHQRDEGALWRALLNQIDATRLAMREVRAVNPAAELIQTDDLGFTHAASPFAEQAAHENIRRWITWDLLAGRVTRDHPMFEHIGAFGLRDRLLAIADDPCPADVVGVNHYLTSERYLDRPDRWPVHMHGGNGRQVYVDVEAVRVAPKGPLGLEAILRSAADRYGARVALTECHNGCTRDEQMRWFLEAWRACERLRGEGLPIIAATAWSLFGAYDWDSLLTRRAGRYEPGVFDVSSGVPRETAMASLLRDLASGRAPTALGSSGPGWWRRDIRFDRVRPPTVAQPPRTIAKPAAPILILGATGTLGRAIAHACRHRALPHVLIGRDACALDDAGSIREALAAIKPAAVINTAGYVRVDAAEADAEACWAANAVGAITLARACAEIGAPLVTFSSDLVFDGEKGAAYVESDPTAPLNVYGATKAHVDAAIEAEHPRTLIARTAAFFQAADPHNFGVHTLRTLDAGGLVRAPDALIVSPTHVPDLANAVLDLLIDGATGVWHLANAGRASWAAFARTIATAAGHDPERIIAVAPAEIGWTAPRPRDVSLSSERGRMLAPLEEAVDRFTHAWRSGSGVRRLE